MPRDGGDGGATAATVEAWCRDMIEARATLLACILPSREAGVDYLASKRYCDDERRAVAAGLTTFDPAQAARCLANVRAEACDSPEAMVAAGCDRVFTGQVPARGTCHISGECAPGHSCWTFPRAPSCPGYCKPILGVGARCGAELGDCESGTVCDRFTSICMKPGTLGESCPGWCVSGFYCGADRKCAARKTSGDCGDFDECALHFACSFVGMSKLCNPLGSVGEPCPDAGCDVGLRCDEKGVCSNHPAIGAPCVAPSISSPGSGCAQGYCDPGAAICTPYKAAGEACTPDPGRRECGVFVDCGRDGKCPADTACHLP